MNKKSNEKRVSSYYEGEYLGRNKVVLFIGEEAIGIYENRERAEKAYQRHK